MPNDTAPDHLLATMKAAARRIRRGVPLEMDHAICDAFDAQNAPVPTVTRAWYDLPMAADAWREAGRASEVAS